MIKAIAVDDEPPALEIIEAFCSRIDFIDLQRTFTKPSEALKHIGRFPIDLMFLDINMPSVSGIEFKQKAPPNIMAIFTTAYSEYAVDGFNLNAVDYLLKPFTIERFTQAVNKARDYYNFLHQVDAATNSSIYLRADYSLIKIDVSDILFIEGEQDYLKIHLQSQKPVVVRMTMKAMEDKLPAKDFIRVHRSYIVPVNRIKTVRNKTIDLEGKKIPIGPKYEEDFFKLFNL